MINWFKKKKVEQKLTDEQLSIIAEEVKSIRKIIKVEEKIVDEYIQKQKNDFELKQRTCDICKSTNVVNKHINEVKYSTTYPKFVFQQPTRHSYTVSKYIKHCSDCGNEWEKKEWYDRYTFKDIRTYYEKFCMLDRYTTNELPKYFHAESMYKAFIVYKAYGEIPLEFFKNNFKSIVK